MSLTATNALVSIAAGSGTPANQSNGGTLPVASGQTLTFALQSTALVQRWELTLQSDDKTLDGKQFAWSAGQQNKISFNCPVAPFTITYQSLVSDGYSSTAYAGGIVVGSTSSSTSTPTLANLLRGTQPASVTAAQTMQVYGYATAGDGGHGVFDWIQGNLADDGGVTFVPTGQIGVGAWVRRTTNIIEPYWWGAKGDGATDDYAAITSAVTYAQNTGKPAIVFFRATTSNVYIVSKPLRVAAHNIVFEGSDPSVTIQSGTNPNATSYPVAYIGRDLGDPIISTNLSPSGTTGYRTRGAFRTAFVTANNSIIQLNQGLTIDLGFSSASGYWNYNNLGQTAPTLQTTGTFTQPAQFGTVTIPMTNTSGLSGGQIVTIADSGRYNVTTVNANVSIVASLANAYPGIAQGSTVASGKYVIPAIGNGSNGLTVRCKIDPVQNLTNGETRAVVGISGKTRNSAPTPTRSPFCWTVSLFGSGGKNVIQFTMQVQSGTVYTVNGSVNVPAGSLTDIAVCYNGTDIRIFVGGALDTTQTSVTGGILQTSYQSFYLGMIFGQMLSRILDSGYGFEIAELWVHQTPAYQSGYTPTTTPGASALFQEFLLSFDPSNIISGYPGWVLGQVAVSGSQQAVWLPWNPNNIFYYHGFQMRKLTLNNANTFCLMTSSMLLMTYSLVTFSGACGPLFRNYSYDIVIDQCTFTGGSVFSNTYSTAMLLTAGAQFVDIRSITINPGFIHAIMALGSSLRVRGAYIECGRKTVILAQGNTSIDLDGISIFDDGGVSCADYAFTIESCTRFALRGEAIGYTPSGTGCVYAFDAVQAVVVDITQTSGANVFFHNSPGQSLYPIEFTNFGTGVPMQASDGAGVQSLLLLRGRSNAAAKVINFSSDANLTITNNSAISSGTIQFTDTGAVLTAGRNISGLPLIPGYLYTIINDTAQTLTLKAFSGATSVAITSGSVARVRCKWATIGGTVAANNNGVLTGTGTSFLTALQAGGLVTFDPTGTLVYSVASITNNTSADLQEAISGGIPGGSKMYAPVYVAA